MFKKVKKIYLKLKRKLKKISLWDIIWSICRIFIWLYNILKRVAIWLKNIFTSKEGWMKVKKISVKFMKIIFKIFGILWWILKIIIKVLKWLCMLVGATLAIIFTCLAYIVNARKINLEESQSGIMDEL